MSQSTYRRECRQIRLEGARYLLKMETTIGIAPCKGRTGEQQRHSNIYTSGRWLLPAAFTVRRTVEVFLAHWRSSPGARGANGQRDALQCTGVRRTARVRPHYTLAGTSDAGRLSAYRNQMGLKRKKQMAEAVVAPAVTEIPTPSTSSSSSPASHTPKSSPGSYSAPTGE